MLMPLKTKKEQEVLTLIVNNYPSFGCLPGEEIYDRLKITTRKGLPGVLASLQRKGWIESVSVGDGAFNVSLTGEAADTFERGKP